MQQLSESSGDKILVCSGSGSFIDQLEHSFCKWGSSSLVVINSL